MTTKPITQNVSRFVSPTRDVVSITHRDMWGNRISIRYAQTPSSRGKKHTKWVVTRITAEGHYAELSKHNLTHFIVGLTLHAFNDSRLTSKSGFEGTITIETQPLSLDGSIYILRDSTPSFYSLAKFGWEEQISSKHSSYSTQSSLRSTYAAYAEPVGRLISVDAAVDFSET